MTTSPMRLQSVASREDVQLTPAQLGYMTSRAQSEAHETVLKLFLRLSASDGLTRAFIARRLGKKPEQVTRWLGAPGNLTVATLAQLLAAMGHVPNFGTTDLRDLNNKSNEHHVMSGCAYRLPPQTCIETTGPAKESIQNSILALAPYVRQEQVFRSMQSAIENQSQYSLSGALT